MALDWREELKVLVPRLLAVLDGAAREAQALRERNEALERQLHAMDELSCHDHDEVIELRKELRGCPA